MAEETWGGREKYLFSRIQVSYQDIMASTNVQLKPSYATPPAVEPSRINFPAYTIVIEQGPGSDLPISGIVYASLVARNSSAALGLAEEVLQGFRGWLPEILLQTLKVTIVPNPAFTSYVREAKELQLELEAKSRAPGMPEVSPMGMLDGALQRSREIDLGESMEEY